MTTEHGIILAAGRGSRMGNATAEKPKCFTKLNGQRLLDFQLDALKQVGVSDIGIVTGYQADKFDERVRYFHNEKWQSTNMVSSLLVADEWLSEVPCLISYSDIVYPHQCLEILKKTTGDIAITYDPDWYYQWNQRFEDVFDDAESFVYEGNKLLDIGNRVTSIEEAQGQYMGLLKTTPTGWLKIKSYVECLSPDELTQLDMTSLLRGLLTRQQYIEVAPIDSWWFEVDSQSDAKVAEKYFIENNIEQTK